MTMTTKQATPSRSLALPLLSLLAAAASCSSEPSGSGGDAAADPDRGAPRVPVATRPAPKLDRKHPFSVHDMVRMERLGAPQPSPDGKWILHTRQTWDPDANQKTTSLWIVSVDASESKRLTTAKGVADFSPVWAPDSRSLLFCSTRDGGGKVWSMRLDGGEPRVFFKMAVEVDNLRLSPDGATLAFSAEVFPGTTPDETAKRDADAAKNPVKAKSYESLMVRHWDTWEDGKRNHLFALPLTWDGDGNATAGAAVDLMKELDGDCPTKPFGGSEDFVFSPDGKEIAYVAHVGTDR